MDMPNEYDLISIFSKLINRHFIGDSGESQLSIKESNETTNPTRASTGKSSTITSTLRDRRPFHLPQHHQQPLAQFNITNLETQIGCNPGCAVLTQSELDGEQQFVIANDTVIFSYVGDDKRLALGIEGVKLGVHWWFNYLITVTKENRKSALIPTTTSSSSNSATIPKPQSNILSQLTAR